MFIREMRQTWILIIISIVFIIGTIIMFSSLGWRYWCFGFSRKAFLYLIFHVINVYPWNGTSLDTHNNIRFFLLWALQSCSPHWTHDIVALDLQEKLFFPPFSLWSKFIHGMIPTRILLTISIFLSWALQSCSPYWTHGIDALDL